MKKLLITGCNGQLGRSLNQLLKDTDNIVINTDVDTLDICDAAQVMEFVGSEKPDIIINCAAHTAVDKCETDRENAARINALGPRNLAEAAHKFGAEIVQVSTDYVFDGGGKRPYVESDDPNPQSVYGSTKLDGEKAVMEETDRYYIIRTAWLYGQGKNFVETMLMMSDERDEITVVNDQYGSPTSSLELARMILYVTDKGVYGIYHGTCEGETSWCGFAREIMRLAGSSTKIVPVTTEEYTAAVAKRPMYSVLENKKLNSMGDYRMKPWEDALKEYMGNRMQQQ